MGADHVLLHVLGMRARVADAVDPVDRVDHRQQLRKGGLVPVRVGRKVAAVAVHVLAQERDLADAVGGEALGFGDQLSRVAARLPAAGRGDDAIRADAVAALADLEPALELSRALGRQVAREVLELEVALRSERVGVQELGQAVDLPGAERDVDEREPPEDLVLDRLRPAPADADHALGVLALQPLGLAQVCDEAVVSGLADRAGVEEDQVGVAALLGLRVAQRLEHPLHALGIVLVHLAPEGGQVEALARHRRSGYREAEDLPAFTICWMRLWDRPRAAPSSR